MVLGCTYQDPEVILLSIPIYRSERKCGTAAEGLSGVVQARSRDGTAPSLSYTSSASEPDQLRGAQDGL